MLQRLGAHDRRLVHLEQLPARPARPAPWPDWADPGVVAAYRRTGVEQPWVHQASAADAAHAGRHTVIATGSGSGKSLAAWLPVLTAVRESSSATARTGSIGAYTRRPTALYLSPTKALAADQLAGLQRLLDAGGLRSVRVTTCDGDTPVTERDWARDHADVVLSNPDFLHYSLLPGHQRWQRLLRGLRYVVVDECHAYRGILGAHVALILRRLLRLAEHYGAAPAVVLASATAGSPDVTAARLVGVPPRDVVAVTDDGAPAGPRTIALWQPALAEGWPAEDVPLLGSEEDGEEDGPRRSATAEAADLLADLVSAGSRALVFVRSRSAAESVAEQARRQLTEVDADLALRVAAYRGGYLPEERRELERALRTGELRALATTNALELGVDVAGLDAVLIAGWPGTRASLWQQVGRTGRAGAPGLAVLIASGDPLDGYLVHHPEAIFGTAPEATTFDPANPYVLAPHLCAAAGELPLREADLPRFGLAGTELLDELVAGGLLRRRPTGWFWDLARRDRPQDLTSLRGDATAPVTVVEAGTGTVLGNVDGARADASVHPGAVYVHQGRTFVVDALEEDAALVHEEPALPYRTKARSSSSVRIVAEREHRDLGPVGWAFGDVEVTSRVTGYDRRRVPGLDILGTYPLEMPERLLATTAVWWTIPAEVCRDAGVGPEALAGALHAAEHASIGLLPLLATCDRWDVGGLSVAVHPQTGLPTVFVHDGYPGGAGFAEQGFRVAHRWVRATLDAVAGCPCAAGCPSCVQSPKCGNANSPLDKAGALRLLRLLLRHSPAGEPAPAG